MPKTKSKQTAAAAVPPSELSLKERLALERKAKRIRKKNTQFILSVVFGSVLLGIIVGLIGGAFIGAGLAAGIICLVLSYKFPRAALYGFILYMPFSGTVTYTLSSSGSPVLQLAKDAFYIPACIAVFMLCVKQKQPFVIPKSIQVPLGILLTFCFATLLFVNGLQQLTSKGEQPILMGILGLKVLIGYLPLITCTFYLIRDRKDLELLLRMQVGLIITCCALAFVQYMFLKTGRCQGTTGTGADLFQASIEARCFVGGALLYTPEQGQIRLPGTFVAPWQWGWFLISSAFFGFTVAFSDPKWYWRIAGLVSLAVTFMMAVLSGQRIALALVPVAIVIQLILSGQIANLKRFIPVGVGLALILGIAMANNPAVVQERVESFQSRWQASPPTAFIEEQIEWAVSQQEGIFGRGLGRATNSARTFGKTALVETYHPKVLYEIGPLGLFALLGLFTTLVVSTFKVYRSVKQHELRNYGACLWVFVLFISYFPYYYPLDVDPVAVYFWFAVGIILSLPKLEEQERLNPRPVEDPKAAKKRKKKKRQSRKRAKVT
ncbi:MAG: hormogonium polysaccharide biosynthesis protein HpsL [Thainema sp.]